MLKISTLAFSFIAVTWMSTASEARQKISVQAAESVCLQRIQRLVRAPYGRDSSGPSPNQIKDRYRSCVWAKSGQYPRNRLNVRGFRISITPDQRLFDRN